MAARPLLRLISHLLSRRRAAGGSVTLSHVKAHSVGTDMDSVGNRLADFQANRSRVSTRGSAPRNLGPLSLSRVRTTWSSSSDSLQQRRCLGLLCVCA